jgi:hypothetical protein
MVSGATKIFLFWGLCFFFLLKPPPPPPQL